MEKDSLIYVAGTDTLIGAAILKGLHNQGYQKVLGGGDLTVDLTDARQMEAFFSRVHPEFVIDAAGKSGGIEANRKNPAGLMLDNLMVESHLIDAAYRHGVKKLLYLASSCCYPRDCAQPMRIESLMTGPLEPTNEAYAVAKIAGIKLCQAYRQQYGSNFIVGIPANAFGIDDDFSREDSHVVPAMLRRMHEAKIKGIDQVEIWGTGIPRREFIFADDLADACIFVMNRYDEVDPINLGGGVDVSIRELAQLAAEVVGFKGRLSFDATKPDGMPLKALDSSRLLGMGWTAKTPFIDALKATYDAYVQRSSGDY